MDSNAAAPGAAFERLRQVISDLPDPAPISIAELRDGSADASTWAQAGELLLRVDAAAASALLDAGIRQHADSATLHYLHGNALRMSARPVEAEAALREAIALDPAHANASLSLAHLLREQGRMRALADVMTALWHHEAAHAGQRSAHAGVPLRMRAFRRSRFPDRADPRSTSGRSVLLRRRAGEIALVLGRFDEARAQSARGDERSIRARPRPGCGWPIRIVSSIPTTPTCSGCARVCCAPISASMSNRSIGFALGKALDDLGEYAEAARILRQANARWRAAHPWDADAWQRFVDAQLATAALQPVGVSVDTVPVFIVGLPRSGTTLAASLLARDARSARARRAELDRGPGRPTRRAAVG